MIVRAKNLADLHDQLTWEAVRSSHIQGFKQQIYSVVGKAESCSYDLDMADVWLSPPRWNQLTRQYLSQEHVEQWVEYIGKTLRTPRTHGQSFLRTRSVIGRVNQKKKPTRRWGSCMLGYSFARLPEPTLTMHSRATLFGYIAPLDLGVAYKLAELLGNRLEIGVDEIKFTWFLEQGTISFMSSAAWWYTNEEAYAALRNPREKSNGVLAARKMVRRMQNLDREGVLYGDEPYSIRRRARMRWHQNTKPKGYGNQFLGEGQYANVRNLMKPLVHTTIDSLPFHMYQGETDAEVISDDWEEDQC